MMSQQRFLHIKMLRLHICFYVLFCFVLIHTACQKLIIKNNSDLFMFLKEVSYAEQGCFFAHLIKSSNIK